MIKKSLIAIFVVVFAIVAYFVFIFVFNKISDKILGVAEPVANYQCALQAKPRVFKNLRYYTGPLVDTHIHMPVAYKLMGTVAEWAGFENMPSASEISIDYLNCLFETEGIIKAFGFFITPNIYPSRVVDHVKYIEEKYPDNG